MKRLYIAVALFGVMLGGCSREGSLALVPAGLQSQSYDRSIDPHGYKRLFTFHGSDGAGPMSALVDFRGTLYGTTSSGGNYSIGGGTVYSFATNGAEKVIHDFGPHKDGRSPASDLTALNGVLYGTTQYGGKYNGGVLYSVTTSGEEHVLHNFGKPPDGKNPASGLTVLNGTLYGTTEGGGRHNGGTAFEFNSSDMERVVYNFGATEQDGRDPEGDLIVVKGLLYGTTFNGAACGTVFGLTTSGEEKILHTFNCEYSDGDGPDGGLVAVKDTLYGVTFLGGGSNQSGTVYSVTTSGKERVLHSFGKGNDGKEPEGALVLFNGNLYGATNGGGRYANGTVFSITKTGTEQMLYSFGGSADDGKNPFAGLVAVKGFLYGTTANGGSGYHPAGTIYEITP